MFWMLSCNDYCGQMLCRPPFAFLLDRVAGASDFNSMDPCECIGESQKVVVVSVGIGHSKHLSMV